MTDWHTIYLLLPEITLIAAATLIYVAGAFWNLRRAANWMAAGAIVIAAAAMFVQDDQLLVSSNSSPAVVSGPLAVDLFGHTARWGILAVGLMLVALTARMHGFEQQSEEAASILLMLAGLMLVAVGNELILLFVGLELVSIPTYVVLYIGRRDEHGQEAASKYFFLSILSSAILLYGFSFLYGIAGSTRLEAIAAALTGAGATEPSTNLGQYLAPLAMLFIFAGLAFRLTAVPFHFYAPDVYQGTSNGNAGLLSTLPKIAGLVVLARILLAAMPGWESMGWKVTLVVSVLTMTLGNILALWQDNIRRMLAYSSIAHAGYLLIGLAVALAARTTAATAAAQDLLATTAGLNGLGAALFYLAVYMFATLGTFAALTYLGRDDRQIDRLDELTGLNRRHPVVALIIAAFMFSLAGIPPLAGFWGKFSLLYGALTLEEFSSQGDIWLRPWFLGLALVAVLNAAIAAAYYLRVIGIMYFRPPPDAASPASRAIGPALAMAACAALVIGIGLLPGRFLDAAVRAGQSVVPPQAEQAAGNVLPTEKPAIVTRHAM